MNIFFFIFILISSDEREEASVDLIGAMKAIVFVEVLLKVWAFFLFDSFSPPFFSFPIETTLPLDSLLQATNMEEHFGRSQLDCLLMPAVGDHIRRPKDDQRERQVKKCFHRRRHKAWLHKVAHQERTLW